MWALDGFAGGLFELTGAFMPPPPPGAQPPTLWGGEDHATDVFGLVGANATVTREVVELKGSSVDDFVRHYAEDFGPFVVARGMLEPQGRWDEFLDAFGDLVRRFNSANDGTARIPADYLLISIGR